MNSGRSGRKCHDGDAIDAWRAHARTGTRICVAAGFAHAQTAGFPNRPIKMIVGFAAGGGTDVAARIMAQKMSEILGQAVLVENRTGASGLLAAEDVVKSPPDGYTLMMASQTELAVAPRALSQGDGRSGQGFCPGGLLRSLPAGARRQPVIPGAHHGRGDRHGQGRSGQDHFRHRRRRHDAAHRRRKCFNSPPASK